MIGTGKNAGESNGLDASLQAMTLRLLLEKLAVATWVTDLDLRLLATDGAALVALRSRPNARRGVTLYEYLGQRDERGPAIAAHLATLRGEACDFEYELEGRTLSAHTIPWRDRDGVVVGVIGVALDITDLRLAERESRQRTLELRESRKHEPLARVARVRLSEMADVFTTVLGASERLGARAGQAEAELEAVGQLLRASTRGAELVRELRLSAEEGPEREGRPTPEVDGGETILLVDDEPQVRAFVRRALEENGYRVLEAATIDEALSLGASYTGRIHLLLTDVVLPAMSGPQLAARLAPVRPEMRILYMTGYADDAIVHRGVLAAGQALLVKPFTSLGLAHEVRKALRT